MNGARFLKWAEAITLPTPKKIQKVRGRAHNLSMETCLSLASIRQWLEAHQQRLRAGDDLPTVTEIAERAGISRQSLYNLMRDDRTQFGEPVQIRISRIIRQIDAESGADKTNLMRIAVGQNSPAKLFVGHQFEVSRRR